MIDCQQVKQMLPLWVGQDLPDVSSAADVAQHLEMCRECDRQRMSLQSSLEFLQGSSSETLALEPRRPSVWPQLALQISKWENYQNRDRFSGWLPASVMGLAVTLMLAVSIPSILQDFFEAEANMNVANRFSGDRELESLRYIGESKQLKSSSTLPINLKFIPEKRSSALQW